MSIRERSSMVEYQLPKLVTGVRFPSLAPNLRSKFDPENATNRSVRRTFLIVVLLTAFLSGCATAPKRPEKTVVEKRIPGALYHTVRRGETLWSISRAYGVDLQSLIKSTPFVKPTATQPLI